MKKERNSHFRRTDLSISANISRVNQKGISRDPLNTLNSDSWLLKGTDVMDRLWAPWRIKYILSNKGGDCIFCVKPSRKGDRKRLILYRSQCSIIMLNRFPYNSGHLMVAPMKHTGNLEELTAEELGDLSVLLRETVSLLKRAMDPQGFNIGMNIGQIAGAGVTDHLHFHIVPRWIGDTNFMPIAGQTIVVPESLEKTYEKLISVLKGMDLGG